MDIPHSQDRDSDRRSRLTTHHPIEVQSLRERAASQPPRSANIDPTTPPIGHRFDQYTPLTGIPWSNSHSQSLAARVVPLGRSISLGLPQPVPVRSSSFSHDRVHAFGSPHSSLRGGVFSSTFEDDESEVMSDDLSQPYDSVAELSQLYNRRPHSPDNNRSRSQSLAVLRTTPSGGLAQPLQRVPLPHSWKESPFLDAEQFSSTARSRAMSRDLRASLDHFQPIGNGRGSLQSSGSPLRHSSVAHDFTDPTNISPFLRGGNQIFLEDGRLRDLWSSGSVQKEEGWGTGSGSTSRRHSVSVVQARRGTLGLSPSEDTSTLEDEVGSGNESRGRLDNGLSGDLDRLNLNFHKEASERHVTAARPTDGYQERSPASSTTQRNSQLMAYPAQMSPDIPSSSNTGHQHVTGEQHPSAAGWRSLEGERYNQAFSHTPSAQPSVRAHAATVSNEFHHGVPSRTSGQEDLATGQTGAAASRAGQQNISNSELGRGVPLHAIPSGYPLYIVEFKAGRTDLFYSGTEGPNTLRVGDLVIVEADRGRDLGKIVNDTITHAQIEEWQISSSRSHEESPTSPGGSTGKKDLNPKRIYGKATSQDTQLLLSKAQDEEKALQLCQAKVKQKKLPMDVIDAEYQWDRRKLTFYFIADKRIDFRELVRELFRLYKTRIWMASLSQSGTTPSD